MPLPLIIVALIPPLAWIVFEFRRNAVARRICGALTIASACLIGWGVGMLQQLNYNAWYGQASKRLLEGVAETLPPGSPERKIIEDGAERFRPTYENRARYDHEVDSILESLKRTKAE